MARMIDREEVLYQLERLALEAQLTDECEEETIRRCIKAIEQLVPTLTPPNEPLTLISMSDELPPDNERVLVYRPCMADSDTGAYSVQCGWAAKRDASHWARLPDRRPPEGEEET